jgi:hypothetical protein
VITVVCFKWRTPSYVGTFGSEHVNALQRMVKANYALPHRFLCITDDPAGLRCETYPIWDDYRYVKNPTGGGRPACYLRLKLFSEEMRPVLGDRWVMLDLDCVILGNLRSLWNRKEEAVFWRNPHREWPYNGAMMMCKTGARDRVWSEFDPHESPRLTHRKGYRGSDQAWISYCLGSDEAVWTQKDGVYFLPELRGRQLDNAKIVFTTAATAPWTDNCPKWMKRIYRDYLDNSDSRPASSLCTV